jgi:hypothetical protein
VRRLARDGRRRVELTTADQAEFAAYEALSDDPRPLAVGAVKHLRQHDRLMTAMAEFELLILADISYNALTTSIEPIVRRPP